MNRTPLLLVLPLVLTACGKKETGPSTPPPVPVEIATVESRSVPVEMLTIGTVEPIASVQLKAKVSGEILKVEFDDGAHVDAGQTLFRIDPRPFEAAFKRADANLAITQSTLSNANEQAERYTTLIKRGVASKEQFSQYLSTAESQKAELEARQADVDQAKLKRSLDQTVESCVNLVGVNLNTASKHLLTYVSGLGDSLAQNIVNYRTENGAFESRKELKKVPRLGEKAFEQCAGFLRIPDAKNPLDNSAVHPESYAVVEKMAKDLRCSVSELINNKPLIESIDISRYKTATTGTETLTDILQELEKPGRDPRTKVQMLEFDENIRTIADVKEGMILNGIVTNVTNFGCFVDFGIKENGLVHISELADRFVSNPTDVVSLHQHVKVRVLSVDLERKRIQLSMKDVTKD